MFILESLNNFNVYLNQFAVFRGFKFLLGFWLILLTVTSILILYRLVKIGYFTILTTGQEFPVTKGKMQIRWEEAKKRLEGTNPNDWKASVLDTASMLFDILDTIGYEGENLGEKLDGMLPAQLDNIDGLKEANKIKNQIVADPKFQMTKEEARQTVEVFAEALRSIEAIE